MVGKKRINDIRKVNLGSGGRDFPGFTSVDLYHDGADIREDVCTVEFPDDSLTTVICYHCIEHIDKESGVELLRRVYRWLMPGGQFIVETPCRAKCLDLIRQRVEHIDGRGVSRLVGGVGLMGGRPLTQKGQVEYHQWIKDNADRIVETAERDGAFPVEEVPEKWVEPGLHHIYVWTKDEMCDEYMKAGFKPVLNEKPHTHGRRHFRDMRVVGTKPLRNR